MDLCTIGDCPSHDKVVGLQEVFGKTSEFWDLIFI